MIHNARLFLQRANFNQLKITTMKIIIIAILSLMLFSCAFQKEIQVHEEVGKVTNIKSLYRATGNIKQVQWTVGKVVMYQFVNLDYQVVPGEYKIFFMTR